VKQGDVVVRVSVLRIKLQRRHVVFHRFGGAPSLVM
jgi:hypothetical protein